MNPLLDRLAELRRWTRLLEGWRGVCAVFTLVVGVATVVGVADYYSHLPPLVRAMALVGILGGAGFLAVRYLIAPLARANDDLALALRVEEHYPELNDALASTVEFLHYGGDSPSAGSVALRERAIQKAVTQADQIDFRRIVSKRGLYALSAAAVVVALTAGYLVWNYRDFARTAVLRLAEPFGRHTWTRLAINVDTERTARPTMEGAPLVVAVGRPFVLHGRVAGIVPAQARIEIRGQTNSEKFAPIKRDPEGEGTLLAALDMTQVRGKFSFRVLANDGSYPAQPGSWQEVEVLPPPSLVNLNELPSPQIALYPPAYSEMPARFLAPGTKQIEVLAGTTVVLRAAADRRLEEAWIEYQPHNPSLPAVAALSILGAGHPYSLTGSLAGGHAVWGRIPAVFEDTNRTVFSFTFLPWVGGTYRLHLEDEAGLIRDIDSDLNVLVDPLPVIKLQKPARSLTLLPDADVGFRFLVEDEVFAIRSVFVEHSRKAPDGTPLDPAPRKLVLYDGVRFGTALPYLLARAIPGALPGPPLTLRPRNLDFDTHWPLRNQFKEGETVVVQVCADDFCDIYGSREPGRSHAIELHIVGKFELDRVVDEKLGEAQQTLLRLQKMQKDALDAVKEVQQKKEITQKEVDRVVEAEQVQKQIRERVGTRPEEGLRGELKKLQDLLRDNKIKGTEAQEQLGMIKGELDRLAQQELQKIEPELAELRSDLAHAEKNEAKAAAEKKGSGEQKGPGEEKKSPEEKKGAAAEKKEPGGKDYKDTLARAAALQNSAKKGLDELVQALDPWASTQQLRGEARELHNRQKELRESLDRALQEPKTGPEQAEDMRKKAETQRNLGDQAEKLVRKMRKVQEAEAERKHKETADRLQKAIEAGEPLGGKMRDAADRIDRGANKKPGFQEKNNLQRDQDQNVKRIEKMIDALEGNKSDVAERLQKKRDKAEQEHDRLTKKLEELERRVEKANKIADQEARQAEQQKLAKEHQQLKDELEKHARELARLQEQRASNEVQEAADDAEKAAKKLQQGEDPGEEQKRAQEQLQQAKDQLEQTEEELAREQMALVADKLEGIKARQDAAIERTEEFQRKLLGAKHWTDALGQTLSGDASAQRGLGKETESLRDKLKEAKVFAHLLERGAADMVSAAETMTKRKDAGLENRVDGNDFDEDELKAENERHKETLRLQKQAGRRLGHILDSLKEELAKREEKKEENRPPPEEKKEQPEEKKGGIRAGDGIPPVAQLKALKAEQLDVNEQTRSFAERHPDTSRLDADQRAELERIQQDQSRLMELFQQLTTPAENKGDQP